MTIIHCIRKDRGWLTYCGLSLELSRGRSSRFLLKGAFGLHQNSDAFISGTAGADSERRCLKCLQVVRVQKKRAILKAVALAEKKFPTWTTPARRVFKKGLR